MAKSKTSPWVKRMQNYLPWVVVIMLLLLIVFNRTGQRILDDIVVEFGAGDNDDDRESSQEVSYGSINDSSAPLAEFFTPTVDYWETAIYRWAYEYELNPNVIATVIQIESCGHPYIESPAEAQGLFQVVPLFHFEDGQNQLDIETNAEAGLTHLQQCLRASADANADGIPDRNPDVGLMLVCYNGGFGALYTDPHAWVQESRDYYTWGTGIWSDAIAGRSTSPTLDRWLSIAQWMCDEAQVAIELTDPLSTLD